MNAFKLIPAFFALPMIIGCAMMNAGAPTDTGSPQHPPLPKSNSPLPLTEGNLWTYSYTVHDSAGGTLYPRVHLQLALPRVYGRIDSSLTRISWTTYESAYDEYVYAYEWDQWNHGALVAYRQQNVARRGLYLLGWYDGQQTSLYDTARLWLAYPATAGLQWKTVFGQGVSADTTDFTLVSVNARYYAADTASTGPSPLSFYDCYLYKEEYDDTTAYYYYSESVGALGFVSYCGGKRCQTYQLINFNNANVASRWMAE